MFRAIVLFAILATVFGRVTVPRVPLLDGRIVGGENANINEFPYQVSIRLFDSHMCGGSIIGENTVLTAAHCIVIQVPRWFSVEYGTSTIGGTNSIAAISVIKHELYNANTIDYDIAIIILEQSISFNKFAQPIALAKQPPAPGTNAIVSGWGTTDEGGQSSNTLQKVTVQIVSQEQCNEEYGSQGYVITDRMICAGVKEGGKDACQGDSGGPMIANKELVGVVSWGIGCARPDYSGVYANVANLLPWILANSPSL